MFQLFRIFVYQKTTHTDSVMTQFIIRTRTASGSYDEPDDQFQTLTEAEAYMQSLIDVCGYSAEDLQILEIAN